MAELRLVIADDHPIVLDGLQQLFSLESDLEVVARCTDGEMALEAVRSLRPDILIVDIRMPRRDGLSVLQEIRRERLPTDVIVMTAALDENEVDRAIQLGIKGLVLKEMAPQLMIQCIRRVQAGGQWIEDETRQRALERMVRRKNARFAGATPLTPRELEIVEMVVLGLRNKEIASRLMISEGTVKIHLHSTYEKLQVNGRLELSIYAREHGLVSG